VLRITLTMLIVCGMLDATAVANISTFGIGAYVAADALALGVLALHARRVGWPNITVKRETLLLVFVLIAMIWLFAALQSWLEMTDTWRSMTQTTLRTLLVVHFLICSIFISLVNDRRYVIGVVTLFLSFYLLYGIYDFVAQIVGYPRFLDALRNSHSFSINQGVGLQGWVSLPRLSSLAAESSHTAMHVLLGFFLALALAKRLRRVALIILTFAFCLGTFARTIWIAVAGAGTGAAVVPVLMRGERHLKKLTSVLVVVTGVSLPIAVLLVPFFIRLPIDADLSAIERFDSSKAGVLLFAQQPLLGMGLHGWDNHPVHDVVDRVVAAPGDLRDVLNGVAVYMSALGIAGLLVVYVPLVLLLRSNMEMAAKTWWICAYSLILLGGDYIALVSTWTTIAIVTAPSLLLPHATRFSATSVVSGSPHQAVTGQTSHFSV
jgi:hypothetical protein